MESVASITTAVIVHTMQLGIKMLIQKRQRI